MMRIGLAEARAAAVSGDWDAALLGFQSAARAQPSNALHWMSIGLAESRLDRDDAAADAYRTAAQLSPGDPRPWGALAALSTGTEEIDLLREAARRSNDPQYAFRLASALVAQGEKAEAARYFAIASAIQPLLYAGVPEQMRSRVRAEMAAAVATVGALQARDPHEVEWNAALDANEVHDGAPIQWRIARHVDAGDSLAAFMALAEVRQRDAHARRTWEVASAVARLTCDAAAFEEADANVELLGREEVGADHRIAERRPGLYREPDLGDYQPLRTPSLPAVPQWPLAFVEVPDCGW
jgi:tetratricopeptide (TPR) repeat protein